MRGVSWLAGVRGTLFERTTESVLLPHARVRQAGAVDGWLASGRAAHPPWVPKEPLPRWGAEVAAAPVTGVGDM